MTEPVTWMYIATALAAGTTYVAGENQAAQQEAEAKTADLNAQAAAEQANAAEEMQRRRNRQFLAKHRAAIAEAGIGFGGTSEQLQIDSAVAAELDALNIRYEGRLRGINFQTAASSARAGAASARTNGYLSIAGELLGGASQAYQMKRT